ncbi:hypothetical protein IWZ01DRAFT_96596 [Phyllosticta capitalensis]
MGFFDSGSKPSTPKRTETSRGSTPLRKQGISWPLTRSTGADVVFNGSLGYYKTLPRLERSLTAPEHPPVLVRNKHKPTSSSYPEPLPSTSTPPVAVAPPDPNRLAPPPTTPSASIAVYTPPASATFPSVFRYAPELTEASPPPSPTQTDWKLSTPECNLARSNARRRPSSRRTSAEDPMANELLNPRLNGARARQAQAAKEAQKAIEDRAELNGVAPPPYDFLELIGKGTFGRVYKGKHREQNQLVAIKICDIDKVDYGESSHAHRDETIKQLVKETSILRQLKDSAAKNVNRLYESFSFHSQLWLITEYVAGGSVRTLMRATPGGSPSKPMPLEEHYIIPIAREVTIGLKFVHDAGILHRDIKCANIMISQEGRVQLIDFGVSGLMETSVDKRSTIIGTPNWMPPELIKDQVGAGYGTEVDCWALGCTIYEMAHGLPPDAGRNLEFLAKRRQAPRLEGPHHSPEIKDFVAFILKDRPYERPSVREVLEHPYIFGTEQTHPNRTLSRLVKRFLEWQDRGGNRSSLWAAGGAAGLDPATSGTDLDDDWVFSTTAEFERDFQIEKRISMVDNLRNGPATSGGKSMENGNAAPRGRNRRFEGYQKAMREQQIKRGEEAMQRLFNLDAPDYKYGEDPMMDHPPGSSSSAPDRSSYASDLALRNWEPNRASNRITMIDLDAAETGFEYTPNLDLDLANASTLRASRINRLMREFEDDDDGYTYQPNRGSKRATKDWKFPFMDPPASAPPEPEESKNRRTMDWTFASSMVDSGDDENDSYRTSRLVSDRRTKDFEFGISEGQSEEDRRSFLPGFSFPPSLEIGRKTLDPSPDIGSNYRPPLRHAATQPVGQYDDMRFAYSAPGSPERSSMIDLDFADVNFVPRPPTAGSVAESVADSLTPSAELDMTTGNPFDLEEQATLSKGAHRTSYHRQSQSEPHKRVSGLLTPQDQEEGKAQGYASDHGPVVSEREDQRRVSVSSRKSSHARDSHGQILQRAINTRRRSRMSQEKSIDSRTSDDGPFSSSFTNAMSNSMPDVSRSEETIRGSRQLNRSGSLRFDPECRATWRYQDALSNTPPSTNGSLSSSIFASPETAFATNGEGEITTLTTPRSSAAASVAGYSPRSVTSFSRQLDQLAQGQRIPYRMARPVPPHPGALDNNADARLLTNEGTKAARDHVLHLKTLRRHLKARGSQAQARRAGHRTRNGSVTETTALSSADNSDVEGVGGTVRRVLRRSDSSD